MGENATLAVVGRRVGVGLLRPGCDGIDNVQSLEGVPPDVHGPAVGPDDGRPQHLVVLAHENEPVHLVREPKSPYRLRIELHFVAKRGRGS